jgi:agmatinase
LRGVGSARLEDVAAARAAGNSLVTARELRARGAAAAVEALPEGAPLVVSLDLHGLDPSVAPGVRAAAPGGLGYDEACDLLAAALDRAPLGAAAITELAPALDPQALTALTAVRLAVHLLAGVARRQG